MAEQTTDQDERDEEVRRLTPKSDSEDSDLRIDLSSGTSGYTRVDWRHDAVVRPDKSTPGDE